MGQRTLMAADGDEWTQHDVSQEAGTPLVQIFRFSAPLSTLSSLLGLDASSHDSSGQGMDGISEGSPLAGVIQVWDHVEGLLEAYPSLPLALCVACAYLSFCRGSRNVALVLGFVSWFKRESFRTALARLLPPDFIVRATIPGAAVWLCAKLVLLWMSPTETQDHDGPSRPYLIPSRTTHTRLVPEKHSFAYSYLLVGIPVGWEGNANGMLSVDASKRPSGLTSSSAWFNVESVEYLERGAGHLGHRGTLDNFLRSQVRKYAFNNSLFC